MLPTAPRRPKSKKRRSFLSSASNSALVEPKTQFLMCDVKSLECTTSYTLYQPWLVSDLSNWNLYFPYRYRDKAMNQAEPKKPTYVFRFGTWFRDPKFLCIGHNLGPSHYSPPFCPGDVLEVPPHRSSLLLLSLSAKKERTMNCAHHRARTSGGKKNRGTVD